jgi:hypothetical protein
MLWCFSRKPTKELIGGRLVFVGADLAHRSPPWRHRTPRASRPIAPTGIGPGAARRGARHVAGIERLARPTPACRSANVATRIIGCFPLSL